MIIKLAKEGTIARCNRENLKDVWIDNPVDFQNVLLKLGETFEKGFWV